jgi:hypothetical protein
MEDRQGMKDKIQIQAYDTIASTDTEKQSAQLKYL